MNIKIIEPIGQSEAAIGSRLKDVLEKGHNLFVCDTRGLTDAELIRNVGAGWRALHVSDRWRSA
jgi:hypothetical protein